MYWGFGIISACVCVHVKLCLLELTLLLFSLLPCTVHDLQPFGIKQFNMSHTIKKLSFGAEYPGIVNPLDGHSQVDTTPSESGGVMFQYFVKVVPTMYQSLDGSTMGTNQFSVTMHQRKVKAVTGETGLPGKGESEQARLFNAVSFLLLSCVCRVVPHLRLVTYPRPNLGAQAILHAFPH